MSSVRYRASGARKTAGHWPRFVPNPAERPVAEYLLLGFLAWGSCQAHFPAGPLLNIGVAIRGPT